MVLPNWLTFVPAVVAQKVRTQFPILLFSCQLIIRALEFSNAVFFTLFIFMDCLN